MKYVIACGWTISGAAKHVTEKRGFKKALSNSRQNVHSSPKSGHLFAKHHACNSRLRKSLLVTRL
jgi:hypothetical protein